MMRCFLSCQSSRILRDSPRISLSVPSWPWKC